MFWSVRHNHRSFPLAVWQCVLQRASSAKSKRQPDARSVSVTQEDLKPDWPDSYGKRPLCFYRVMPEERVGVSACRRSPFAVRRSRRYAATPARRYVAHPRTFSLIARTFLSTLAKASSRAQLRRFAPFQTGQECPSHTRCENVRARRDAKSLLGKPSDRVRIVHWGTRDAIGSISTQPMSAYRQEASTACASYPSLFAGASRSAGHDRRHHGLVGVRACDQSMATSSTLRSRDLGRTRVSRKAHSGRRTCLLPSLPSQPRTASRR
jgi:hypothetical protein